VRARIVIGGLLVSAGILAVGVESTVPSGRCGVNAPAVSARQRTASA
jgi:hypothetical protein